MYSGYSRDSGSSNPTCKFCKQKHLNAKCNIITEPASRKAILRSKAKCFICLRSGHKASECKSNNRCFKCIDNSSKNGNNNISPTLNMTDSVNVESVDN